ncbi:DegV family EDD domain-containing protein [Texas Phoenix palm phytoplasma]|uniref:DegV family EDD domain-containing protein n=2 Tax=Texas Phoenix palm phytoplasma TaxID=176709 RepID=A0ABS5BJ98_9MOLU|nr:DegV family EDD domain-containing protein [Texas Phoenix palm phytoplasma]
MNIKVVSTSTSCLDYFTENHDIGLIRIKIYINNKEYTDGKNLTAYKFYDMLSKNPNLVIKTSQVSLGEVINYFEKIAKQGYKKIFVTTLSKNLSGSYNVILQSKKFLKDKIEVIPYNTNTVCFSEGYFALEAKRLFSEGASIEKVIEHLNFLKKNNTIFFVVNSLTQLINNGRLTKTKGFLGRFFKIKPILQVNEKGQIILIEKKFTIESAFISIIEKIKNYTKNKKFVLFILFTGNNSLKEKLKLILCQTFNLKDVLEMPSTPAIGAHVGDNVIGVGIIITKNNNKEE